MAIEDRAEDFGLAGKLAAELDAGESRLARLGQADLERNVVAQPADIVVRPADRVDAEAHGHGALRPAVGNSWRGQAEVRASSSSSVVRSASSLPPATSSSTRSRS